MNTQEKLMNVLLGPHVSEKAARIGEKHQQVVFRVRSDADKQQVKRAVEKKSGDLVWIDLPLLAPIPASREIPISQPTPIPVLHGLSFRDFALSPDGRSIAVIIPGKRNLLVFPLLR